MEHMSGKTETMFSEQMREMYQTMVCLDESTDDYLMLWYLKERKIYFPSDLSTRFPLEKKEDNGYDAEEWFRIVYKQDVAYVRKAVADVHSGKRDAQNMEYRLVDRNGNIVWMNCRGRVLKDDIIVGRLSENAMNWQIDPMTGLLNNLRMCKDLDKALEEKEEGRLVVFDMDDFKNVNTSYGRAYGNRMIQEMGAALEECVGPNARVYRLDGDRFAVKMIGGKEKEVEQLFDRLKESTSANCSFSAGAVKYPMDNKMDGNTLFQYGEIALNRAKKNGKGRLMFFSARDYEQQLYVIDLTEEIRGSLKNHFQGFELFFQPQISTNGYNVCGAEALLRYHSFYNGLVSPVTFIPILEETGMIIPVGKWILHTAIRKCSEWRTFRPDFVMSINLSYLQLKDESLGEFILEELRQAGLPGSAIILELTESMQLQDFTDFNKLFYELGKEGVSISIDDFGTGYSSLQYLKSLEINEIKIDRCFVSGLQSSTYNFRLLSNIIELASSVNIKVCCEGVENEEELAALEKLHPEKLQGYLFSRPVQASDFEKNFLENTETKDDKIKNTFSLGGENDVSLTNVGKDSCAIMNCLDEIVYIADTQNYELYYLNAAGQRLTGTPDYGGKICYTVLQGRNTPCEFCSNHLLTEQNSYEWVEKNDYLKCRMLMKGKLIPRNGKKARLGVCVKLSESSYHKQVQWVKDATGAQLLQALTLFHTNNDFYQGLKNMLLFVGRFYNAQRCGVFLYSPIEEVWENVYEWQDNALQNQAFSLPSVSGDVIKRWIPVLKKGETVLVKDINRLKAEIPGDWEMLKQADIQCLMVCPLIYNGTLFGFMQISNAKTQSYENYMLREVASYLALEFVRRGFYKAIEEKKAGDFMNLMQEKEILDLTKLGLWIIQVDSRTGEKSMFMDRRMKQITGIEKEMSAREYYDHWYGRINEGYYKYVNTAVEKMIQDKEVVSIEYTWKHPVLGEVPVRCTGVLGSEENGVYTLKGYHRMLSDIKPLRAVNENNSSETFEYNEKKHMIYFHTNRKLIDGRGIREDGFPHSWIKQGIVHPYFAKEFEAAFTDVKEKKDNQSRDILLRNQEKEYVWYHMETYHLGESEQDVNTLLVVLHPTIEEQEFSRQYMRKEDFYKVMLSETIAYAEVDMERDSIRGGGGAWADYVRESMDGNRSYTEILYGHGRSVVDGPDYKAFCQFLDPNAVRERFLAGEEHSSFEYLRKMEDGQMRRAQLVTHMFRDKINSSMYALLYLKDLGRAGEIL